MKATETPFVTFMETLLDANGYSDSHVTGKAGDQGGDILTQDDDEKIIIQAKNYSLHRKVTNDAVQEVLGAIAYYGADKGVVVTNSFFTKSAIELAKVNSITLWDRRVVTQMLEGFNNQKDKSEDVHSSYSSTEQSGSSYSTRYKKGSNKDTVYKVGE
jgi:restriction system protein